METCTRLHIHKKVVNHKRFIDAVISFLDETENELICVKGNYGFFNFDFSITNPQYEILDEFQMFCLYDDTQQNNIQIPINELVGISNTIFEDKTVCGIAFNNNVNCSISVELKENYITKT